MLVMITLLIRNGENYPAVLRLLRVFPALPWGLQPVIISMLGDAMRAFLQMPRVQACRRSGKPCFCVAVKVCVQCRPIYQ